MFVVNDVLYLYGGYCKIFNKGEKAKGVVHSGLCAIMPWLCIPSSHGRPPLADRSGRAHVRLAPPLTDFWSMKLAPDLKGLRWERRKRSPFMPSYAWSRSRPSKVGALIGHGQPDPAPSVAGSAGDDGAAAGRPRSGMAVAVHKTRAVFFGGVFDEDVNDEQMVSVFDNDL